jgi:hypothetical protein
VKRRYVLSFVLWRSSAVRSDEEGEWITERPRWENERRAVCELIPSETSCEHGLTPSF